VIHASIYGRLGGDPVERTTRKDNLMVTASLAVNAARHGEPEITEWINVAAFGRAADALLRHSKGDLVAAMGPLVRQRWTGGDGNPREGWALTAESIVSARTVRPGGNRKPAEERPDASPGPDDEIPF